MSPLTLTMTNLYVADTHALLWHLFKPSRLGSSAKEALQDVDNNEATLYVPVVVIAEALMVIEKKRIQGTKKQFEKIMQQMTNSSNYQIGELTLEIVLLAAKMTQLSGIFDRLIVAEAQAINAPLLTRDVEITASNLVPVIW